MKLAIFAALAGSAAAFAPAAPLGASSALRMSETATEEAAPAVTNGEAVEAAPVAEESPFVAPRRRRDQRLDPGRRPSPARPPGRRGPRSDSSIPSDSRRTRT